MDAESFFGLLAFFVFNPFSILLVVYFICKNKNQLSTNSKYGKLNIWSIIFLILGIISTIVIGLTSFLTKVNISSTPSSSTADGFTIEEFKIIMDVNESNSIDVKEYITVNFYEKGHHGIYRFIPTWLEYTNKDGVTQSRKAKLSNLKSADENYTIDTFSGKKRIKIGNADYTLPIGNHYYEINYTYDMGFDPYENFDEFIFHAFGDYWGTEIKNASITINMPKSIDFQNKLKFYADKNRKEDITSYVNYNISGNTIYANLSSNYQLKSALTIDIELPDGYFVKESNNYGSNSLLICITCILFAIISFVLWKKNGKDLDKVPETVEFYPPEKLDAAEIGYLYKKDTGRKLSIALIIELASKGFIKIIESEDKETQTIVKSNTTDVNKYIKREIKIVKLKEYKARFLDTNYNATKIMKDYFSNNNTENIVTSDFDDFYTNSKYLVDNGYIRIDSDTINNYSKEEIEKMKKELALNEFKGKPKMSTNEKIVYNMLFEKSDETILSNNYTFYKAFDAIEINVRNSFDDKIYDLIASKYMLISSLGFLICTILWGLAFCLFEDLNPKFNYLYIIAFISNMITFVFAILMKRKNSYGEQIKSKINGFKSYIELSEKNQIDMLAEKNPNYFYDILPFAYVLGVSRKWAERFENIPVPTKDMGNFDYFNTNSINDLSNSVIIPSSSSGSSSSGGCSSCGGGCSSCGGGGSW